MIVRNNLPFEVILSNLTFNGNLGYNGTASFTLSPGQAVTIDVTDGPSNPCSGAVPRSITYSAAAWVDYRDSSEPINSHQFIGSMPLVGTCQ